MAEFNVFVRDLEKELTCSICDDIFTEPKTLQCLHSFCFDCIANSTEMCRNQSKQLDCPTCRVPVNIEGGDMAKLPSLFSFESLLELFQAMKGTSSGQNQGDLPHCVGCSNDVTLVSFCSQCGGMICNDCVHAHRTLKTLLGDHQTTMLNEFNHDHLNSYITNQVLCKELFHEKNKLEYYCQTCLKCICQKCVATTHSTHDKVSVEEAAEDAKTSIRRDTNRMKPLIEKYIQQKALAKANMAKLADEIQAAKKRVRDEVQAQMKILQDHENTMLQTLDEILHEQKTKNEVEQRDIDTSIQQVAEYRHQSQEVESKNLTLGILESYRHLKETCNTLSEKAILSTKPVKSNVSMHYVPNLQLLECLRNIGYIVESVTDPSRSSIESLNDVRCGFINQFRIVTRNSEIQNCSTNKALIDVHINDADGNEVENDVQESGIGTGKFTVAYRALKPSPYRILVSIGGKAISNSPQKVNTIDVKAEFKAVGAFGTSETEIKLQDPCSLTLSTSGEIAIVDTGNHRIVIFSADGKYLREFGGKAKGAHLSRPWGIVFVEDRVLVSDNPGDDGRIQEFGIDGAYLRTIYRQEGAELLGMCLAGQNIACLEDGELQRKIKLFAKQTGHLVQEITIDNIIGNPPKFLAYHNGKYFVPFVDQNCVRVFDEDGAFLYTFGEQRNKDELFNCVAGLAIYGADMILVCDAGNHRVQVFTQEGEFIRSFGRRGSELGQMGAPIDLAVAPDSRVLVLECDGSRMQAWR